jgi:hypothetical protein
METREARERFGTRGVRWRAAGTILLTMMVWGCGNLTAGGEDGEAAVVVSGDAPSAPAAVQGLPSAAIPTVLTPAARADDGGEEPDGEVEVAFRLYLVGPNDRVVSLSDDEVRVRVDVRGRQEADVVRRRVPAVHYDALRIIFTEIKAEVDSGLIIDGVPVVGEVRVELENASITVDKAIDLDVAEGGSVELLVDLNTETWLRSADPDLRRVAQAIFRDAVTVVVR